MYRGQSVNCGFHYQCGQSVALADAVTISVGGDIFLRVEISKGIAVFILGNKLMTSIDDAANAIAVAISNYRFVRHKISPPLLHQETENKAKHDENKDNDPKSFKEFFP